MIYNRIDFVKLINLNNTKPYSDNETEFTSYPLSIIESEETHLYFFSSAKSIYDSQRRS
jgi:hypothetical protein